MKSLKFFITESGRWIKNNSTAILTATSVIGLSATTALAISATLKASKAISKAAGIKEDIPKKAIIKSVIPFYIPTITVGSATIASIIGAYYLNKRQKASLIGACTYLSNSFSEYKAKVNDIYGNDAANRIKKAIAEDKYHEYRQLHDDFKDEETMLFYDEYSGRFFESTMLDVRNAEYHLNRNFILRGEANLNEFYRFLGIPETDDGEIFGWLVDIGFIEYGYAWIDFEHELVQNQDGDDYYIISMPFEPHTDTLEY